jgi:hypothetical protein
LIILPVLASKLEALQGVSLPSSGHWKVPSFKPHSNIVKPASPALKLEFEKFDTKFIKPILSLEPREIRKFVDENSDQSVEAFLYLSVRVLSEISPEELQKATPMVTERLMQFLDAKKGVFPDRVIDDLRDSFSLEMDNYAFLMKNHLMALFAPEITGALEKEGLDPLQWARTMVKWLICIDAAITALASGDKRLEPNFVELSHLASELAEEDDSTVTTLDILLNQRKKSDLEEAYAEFSKAIENHA